MSNFGDWLGGGKEAKMRADGVARRRLTASARAGDLDLEVQDLTITLELAEKDFPPDQLAKFRAAVDNARVIMFDIFKDVNVIANDQMPERITDQQAFDFTQPALRIEARSNELTQLIARARKIYAELDKPRQDADGYVEQAEAARLQAEIGLQAIRSLGDQLKASYAESFPMVEAAILTATKEIQAAAQMATSARIAINRRSFREAGDLARRASAIFDSAGQKIEAVHAAHADYNHASKDADDTIAAALRYLAQVRDNLNQQVAVLAYEPNHYLAPAVQRIGEARRAYKSNPPHYVSALKLAKEGMALLEQVQENANQEAVKLQQMRMDASGSLEILEQELQDLRSIINQQRSVPTSVNRLYAKAREDNYRLKERYPNIDGLSLPQLSELYATARQIVASVREGLKLAGQ